MVKSNRSVSQSKTICFAWASFFSQPSKVLSSKMQVYLLVLFGLEALGASFNRVLNSSSVKSSCNLFSSRSPTAKSSIPKSNFTSFFISVSWRESFNCSMPARKYSPTLPLNSSAFSIIVSMSLCSVNQLTAVFGPTFSTPGMLSEVSPTKAK